MSAQDTSTHVQDLPIKRATPQEIEAATSGRDIKISPEAMDKLLNDAFKHYRSDEQRYTVGAVGDTIKGIELQKTSDRLAAFEKFHMRSVFSESIVDSALKHKGDTGFYQSVGRYLASPKLKNTEYGVAPYLDLEMRCVMALLGGDECLSLLLNNGDRDVIKPGSLASWGTHFITSLHHMIAMGLYLPDRVRLQSSDKKIRSTGQNGVRKHFWRDCGTMLEWANMSIMENRERILRQTGARAQLRKNLPANMQADQQDPASMGSFFAVFRYMNEIKRKLQIMHNEAVGLEVGGELADAMLASDKQRATFVDADDMATFAAYLSNQTDVVKSTLGFDTESGERFLRYYTVAQMMPSGGGKDSRYVQRLRYWAGMKFELIRNAFLVTTTVSYEGKTYDMAKSEKILKVGDDSKYYTTIQPALLRSLHRDIEMVCDKICELGMFADMVMQVGALHCMMQASLMKGKRTYITTMHAVSEGRRRIAKRVKLVEAYRREQQVAVLTKYQRLIDSSESLLQDVKSGIAHTQDIKKDKLLARFQAFKQENDDIDKCVATYCALAFKNKPSVGASEMRQHLMFNFPARGCGRDKKLTPSLMQKCMVNVTRVPTSAIFWPNMAERSRSYEICQRVTEENKIDYIS